MRTKDQLTISEHAGDCVRTLRLARGWKVSELHDKLHDHRCRLHPGGYDITAYVLMIIENGTPAQHGYPAGVRAITVDEMYVFAEVFEVKMETFFDYA
jgi:hypothetical protein